MKYFDKEGKQIEAAEWESLIRDKKYTRLEFNSYGKASVDSQWLGIQTEFCVAPTLFTTRLMADKKVEWFWHDSSWTLEDLRNFHFDTCKEYQVLCAGRRK